MSTQILGTPVRDWIRTALGCLIVAIVLFPLYWMTNV
jgi:ABC-type glycerol-3-phosphate transport system permease component